MHIEWLSLFLDFFVLKLKKLQLVPYKNIERHIQFTYSCNSVLKHYLSQRLVNSHLVMPSMLDIPNAYVRVYKLV